MNISGQPFPQKSRRPWRLIALILCVGGAVTAALLTRERNDQQEAAIPAEASAEQILTGLPDPTDTATGKLMASAIEQVRQKPEEAAAWITLGDILAQELRDSGSQKYYAHAELAYRRALKLKPQAGDALTGMAWVFGGRHLFDQSMEWANKAIGIDPGNVAAQGILGDACLELGDYDKAFQHYQKMMDLRPDLSSWSRGAWLLWLTGDKGKAMWLMDKAVRAGAPFAENTAWCRARLAMMQFHDGALPVAAQTLEPLLAAGSRNIQVLLAAGRIAAAQGDSVAAAKHFSKALENGPSHDALVALGDLRMAEGDKEGAEKYYAQVEALHTALLAEGVHDHTGMAKFFADHDRNLVEALRLSEQHKLTKNVIEADVLAWVYFKNGDQPRAIEAMKRALAQKTQDAEMEFHAGMIAAAAGDKVSAQNHLQKALNYNPRFHPLLAPLASKKLDELGGAVSASALPPSPPVKP